MYSPRCPLFCPGGTKKSNALTKKKVKKKKKSWLAWLLYQRSWMQPCGPIRFKHESEFL